VSSSCDLENLAEIYCSRSTKVTAELVREYHEMIKTTVSDLEDRLEIINKKLNSPLPTSSRSGNDTNERKRIIEEIESTKQCLNICTDVFKHINGIRPSIFEATFTPSMNEDFFVTTKQALESCNKTLDNQMQQLQSHLQELSVRLEGFLSYQGTDVEKDAERQRILDDFSSTQQSLNICLNASERASKDRLNIYADVAVAEDSSQYIISTVGDLISAKNISAGARSLQCMGQLSDESLQKLVASPRSMAESGELQTQPGATFERYGAGYTLNRKPTP
jgi:Fungal N-terminal domain of STAND proteins